MDFFRFCTALNKIELPYNQWTQTWKFSQAIKLKYGTFIIITSLAFWFFFLSTWGTEWQYVSLQVILLARGSLFFNLQKVLILSTCIFLFGQQNISTGTYFWWEKENPNILLGAFKSPHGPAEFLPGAQILWWSAPA